MTITRGTPELDETIGWAAAASHMSQGSLGLLTRTGSRAYGTDNEHSDHDFRGVYIASLRRLSAMAPPVQTVDASEPHDVTLYELAHFARLAAKGNPTALEVLWGDEYACDLAGSYLRDSRKLFLSKRVVYTYGGYALSQLEKARKGTGGSRGATHHKRTKFKLHTLRLLYVGWAILDSGEVPVRVPDPEHLLHLANEPMEQVEACARSMMGVMDKAAERTTLPDRPDEDAINNVLYTIRMEDY